MEEQRTDMAGLGRECEAEATALMSADQWHSWRWLAEVAQLAQSAGCFPLDHAQMPINCPADADDTPGAHTNMHTHTHTQTWTHKHLNPQHGRHSLQKRGRQLKRESLSVEISYGVRYQTSIVFSFAS